MPSAAHMVCRLHNTVCTIILYQCHHCRPTHGLPPMVCCPSSMVPMVCRQWCAAHPPCPWYAAHPYSWLSAHPSTPSTSYTTSACTYSTIYTTIGYGHCRPTHGMPPMVCCPSIVPIVCHPSIFMALGPPVYIIYIIYHLSYSKRL
jgi:hypothetical protein